MAAAAYRAAECLFDEELGRSQTFKAEAGAIHSEVTLPDGAPSRWLDRATLLNEVTAGEVRRNGAQRKSQLARETEIALPRELSQAEAVRLPEALMRPRTSRDPLEYTTWSTLADERQQAAVEVPGLSAEAGGVLQALEDAGTAGAGSQGGAISTMFGGEQQRAATVAKAWGGVLSRPKPEAELERFEATVLERFTPEQHGALFQEWEAREALRYSASTLRLPRPAKATRVGLPDLPSLVPAVFVRMIGHARVLTPLQQAHEVRLAQDAEAVMRAVRKQVVEERMAAWMQVEGFRQAEWAMGQVRRPRAKRMPQAEANTRREGRIAAEQARIDAEVRTLPRAELLRIKVMLDAQDRQAEAEARARAQRSVAEPSVGPRPTHWYGVTRSCTFKSVGSLPQLLRGFRAIELLITAI